MTIHTKLGTGSISPGTGTRLPAWTRVPVPILHKSSRRNPVFFARTFIAAGPSVTRSWYANNTSAQPGRSRMRCEVPLCRLILQPILNSAASACFAFVEGQSADCLLGRNETYVHGARHRLAMLQPVCNQPQSERLDCGSRLLPRAPIRRYSRKGGDVRQPPSILFPVILNRECNSVHRGSLLHATIMPPICAEFFTCRGRTIQ